MGGWTGLRAPLNGISLAALLVAGGLSAANAQTTLDPITVLATKTIEATIDALAMVSVGPRRSRSSRSSRSAPRTCSAACRASGSASAPTRRRPRSTSAACRTSAASRSWSTARGRISSAPATTPTASSSSIRELVAAVDVARGPVANIYGSGAIGGVVSFRTKDVEDVLKPGERYGGLANVQLGTQPGARARLVLRRRAAEPECRRDRSAAPTATVATTRTATATSCRTAARGGTGSARSRSVRPTATRSSSARSPRTSAIAPGRTCPNQESVYLTNVVNNILTARYRYSQPGRQALQLRRQRLLEHDRAGSAQGPERHARAASAIRSPASSATTAASRSTPWASISTTRRASTSATSATRSPMAATCFRDEVNNIDPTGNGEVTTPDGERTVSGAFFQWKGNYSRWLEVIGALRYDNYELKSAHQPGERRSSLAEGHGRHHAGERLHSLRHLRRRLSRARRHRDADRGPASAASRLGLPGRCSPSCRTRICGRRSARPRKSAST